MTEDAFVEENIDFERRKVRQQVYKFISDGPVEKAIELKPFLEQMTRSLESQPASHIEFIAERVNTTAFNYASRGGFALINYVDEHDTTYQRWIESQRTELQQTYKYIQTQIAENGKKDKERLERFKLYKKLKQEFEPEKKE